MTTINNLSSLLDGGKKAAWFEFIPWMTTEGTPGDDYKPNCCAPVEFKISTMSLSQITSMLQATGYLAGKSYDREKYQRIMAGKIVDWHLTWAQFKALVSVAPDKIDAFPDDTIIDPNPENKRTALAEIKGLSDWLLKRCQEFAEFDAKLKEGAEKNS